MPSVSADDCEVSESEYDGYNLLLEPLSSLSLRSPDPSEIVEVDGLSPPAGDELEDLDDDCG